jgi:hypothetical protein
MPKQEYQRVVIVAGIRAGLTVSFISSVHKISRTVVYRVKKELEAHIAGGGSYDDFRCKMKVRAPVRTVRTDEFIRKVMELVEEDPSRSMRALAVIMKCTDFTIRRCVEENLRYKSYALRKGQFMTQKTKETRLFKARKLLNALKHPKEKNTLIFFSDEKNFSQDQKVNRKNNRWLCSSIEDVPIIMSTKFPATVMVLGVVSSDGDVMPPYFFEKGLKINQAEYIKVLRTVVKPWMDQVAGDRPYIFQQDGAPAHTGNQTQTWCRENLRGFWPKEIWPPSSPDCNPLDYYVWGVCERDINRTPHNNIASLKRGISWVMESMLRDPLVRACSRFRRRLEMVVQKNGDFIE